MNHPAVNKRIAFGKLVGLLYSLKVTTYVAIPAVSNPYNLFDMRELSKYERRHFP